MSPFRSDVCCGTIRYWDIRNLEVATGLIQRTLPSIPLGWTIGNPSFGKTHPDLIALDFVAENGDVDLYAADRRANRVQKVAPNEKSLNRPTFSPDDSRILVQYDDGGGFDLWRAAFDPTTLSLTGSWHVFAPAASYPSWRFTGRDFLTDVDDDEEAGVPATFTLYQNYPNPFNASTVIPFDTRTTRTGVLEIFNILGQRVREHQLNDLQPGRCTITWDGRNDAGETVPSGLYFYRMIADGTRQVRKMVVLR